MPNRSVCALSLLVSTAVVCGLKANAVDRPDLLGRSNPTPRVVPPLPAAIGSVKLSDEARQLGQALGLLPKLRRIEQLRATQPSSTELLAVKEDVMESCVTAGFEVRAVASRIDRELANASEVLAYLAERRDRAVRLNSYADLISGGISGLISGSMKIADAGGIAPDIIDTVEGGLQSGLATWAIKEQRGDRRREQGMPSILAHLFLPKTEAQVDYPPAVWSYLSSPLPASSSQASRLDLLVERWVKMGVCFTHRGHAMDRRARAQQLSGQTSHRVTVDLLEDRIAMLNDLRSTVVHMDVDLLELMQALRGTRTVD